MASPFFCHRLLEDLGFEPFLGIHLFETPVLVLKLLQAGHQRRIHAAIFGAPLVERRAAHAVFATQLGHRRTGFGLLENA